LLHVILLFMVAQFSNLIVNQRGMITIPKQIRKDHNIKPGTEIAILEIEGVITLVPLLNEHQLQENLIPHEEMVRIYEESKQNELENEL